MTIQMLRTWNGLEQYSVQTLIAGEETRLIAAGLARDYQVGMDGSNPALSDAQKAATQALVSGGGNDYIRWCIPGRDTSGTVFKDTSGKGNDATIDASNSGAFATDARMATVVHVSAGGITQSLAASLCDLATDSIVFAVSMTRADPAASDAVISWGAGAAPGFPGFYVSHRLSAAGVGRAIGNRGNNTLVSGSDTTVKFSNAGGTRETHMLVAYDAPTGSLYLYRDGVLAAANAGLMTGANAFTQTVITSGAKLGAIAQGAAVASVFRGWQGYVFAGKGLPINIGRIAAMLAEAPSTPLRDYEFQFAA
jgi:hypothetical protein